MAVQDLVKGQEGWGQTILSNFQELQANLDGLAAGRLDRPDTRRPGMVYHLADGSTTVKIHPTSTKYLYGFCYDENSTSPAVSYTDDCARFLPASGSYLGTWGATVLYDSIYPCTLTEDGVVTQKLQKEDFTKQTDGQEAVLDGSKGDVMIRFPKLYWDFQRTDSQVYVRLGNYRFSNSAVCYAHHKGMEEKEDLYIGAYLAPIQNWASSVSGSTATEGPFSAFADAIRSLPESSGRTLYSFYAHTLLQILAVLFYKTRDLQSALGKGSQDPLLDFRSGWANQKPFCWGGAGESSDGSFPVRFLGLENWYGYKAQLMTSLSITEVGQSRFWNTCLTPFLPDDPAQFRGFQAETLLPPDLTGFCRKAIATNEFGFLPLSIEGGNGASFFCDSVHLSSGGGFLPEVGGWDTSGQGSGPFYLDMVVSIADDNRKNVARIMVL